VRDPNAHADGYSYCNGYRYRNCDANSYSYTDSNSDCYGHSNSNSNSNTDMHTWGRNTRSVGAGSASSDRSLRGLHGQRWDLCL